MSSGNPISVCLPGSPAAIRGSHQNRNLVHWSRFCYGSLNVKSLLAHIDDRKIFMRGSKIHILCVYKRDSTSVIQKYIYRDLTSLEGNVP